jgi:photosystem II stability/assembly factor-like uncharacterized protein
MKLTITFFLLIHSLIGFSQLDSLPLALQGKIIRSYADDGDKTIVGIKGEAQGDGTIYYHQKLYGAEWQILNHGKALGDTSMDVQAVAFVNDSIYLAGTWKTGLYRSSNKGASWNRLMDFPSNDIRAIRVSDSKPKIVYAATTTKGILKSIDLGLTWLQCAHDSLNKSLASWSLELNPSDPSIIYLATFGQGIKRSTDGGSTWSQVLRPEGTIQLFDMTFSTKKPKRMWAVGSGDGIQALYYSKNSGETWKTVSNAPEAALNTIGILNGKKERLILGTWEDGAFIQTKKGWKKLDQIPFEIISGIECGFMNTKILTWGNGIYTLLNTEL